MFLTVSESLSGRTVLSVLRSELMLSATMVRKLKYSGAIFVNGKNVYVNYTLNYNDALFVDLDSVQTQPDFPAEFAPLDILFEDEYYLAVNKPAGMLTHPSRSRYTGTLANYVSGYLGEGKPCHVINRLDRDTSGIVLFAKSAQTCAAFDIKSAEKEYFGIVFGTPSPSSGVWELPIKRESDNDLRRITSPDGAPAITIYNIEGYGSGFCGLRFYLRTGRTHQIRVHCLSAGTPILGDRLYCTKSSSALSQQLGIDCQLLHARRITFNHPFRKNSLEIHAPLQREDMAKLIKKLAIPS